MSESLTPENIDFDRFEAYLTGKLSSPERERLEKELKNDPSLEESLGHHILSKELIKQEARKEMASHLNDRFETALAEYQATLRPIWQRPIVWAAAASILLFIGYFLWSYLNQPSYNSQQLYAMYMEIPDQSIPRLRDNNTKQDTLLDQWQKVVLAFHKEEYKVVAEQIESLLANAEYFDRFGGQANLYLGVAYLKLDRDEEAIKIFDAYQNSELYGDTIKWYYVLASLKVNDLENAKTLLKRIVADSKHYRLEEAKKLLPQVMRLSN